MSALGGDSGGVGEQIHLRGAASVDLLQARGRVGPPGLLGHQARRAVSPRALACAGAATLVRKTFV